MCASTRSATSGTIHRPSWLFAAPTGCRSPAGPARKRRKTSAAAAAKPSRSPAMRAPPIRCATSRHTTPALRSWRKRALMQRTITGADGGCRVKPGNDASTGACDLHADAAAENDLELFDAHRHAQDLRMRKHHRGDAFGQRLDEMGMALRHDPTNPIGNQVIGENLVQPLRRAVRPRDTRVYREAHLLRLLVLAVERADAYRQHKVMHENAVRFGA